MKINDNKYIFSLIFSVTLAVFVVGSALFFVSNLDFLYKSQYEKDDTMATTGATLEDLMGLTDEIQAYLNGRSDSFDLTLKQGEEMNHVFTQREILHMKDVKDLYQKFKDSAVFCSILFFALVFWLYVKNRKNLYYSLKTSVKIIFTAFLLLLCIIIVNFEGAFIAMHKILFSNDLWLLNYDDMLIVLFPEGFFMKMGIIIVILCLSVFCGVYFSSKKLLGKMESQAN